jgi:glycosyltransferase involved in cell wall biosynthesis
VLGALMCAVSFVAIIFIVIRQLLYHNSAYGWSSMICIIILLGGIQLLSIGILGMYFSKMYLEVKKRPIYIADEVALADEAAPATEAAPADENTPADGRQKEN